MGEDFHHMGNVFRVEQVSFLTSFALSSLGKKSYGVILRDLVHGAGHLLNVFIVCMDRRSVDDKTDDVDAVGVDDDVFAESICTVLTARIRGARSGAAPGYRLDQRRAG